MKFAASVQVGDVFKASKYEVLGSGRFFCQIYGKVQNHWGQIAKPDAMYWVDSVSATTLEGLREEARKRIAALKYGGSLLLRCESRSEFERVYTK